MNRDQAQEIIKRALASYGRIGLNDSALAAFIAASLELEGAFDSPKENS